MPSTKPRLTIEGTQERVDAMRLEMDKCKIDMGVSGRIDVLERAMAALRREDRLFSAYYDDGEYVSLLQTWGMYGMEELAEHYAQAQTEGVNFFEGFTGEVVFRVDEVVPAQRGEYDIIEVLEHIECTVVERIKS